MSSCLTERTITEWLANWTSFWALFTAHKIEVTLSCTGREAEDATAELLYCSISEQRYSALFKSCVLEEQNLMISSVMDSNSSCRFSLQNFVSFEGWPAGKFIVRGDFDNEFGTVWRDTTSSVCFVQLSDSPVGTDKCTQRIAFLCLALGFLL